MGGILQLLFLVLGLSSVLRPIADEAFEITLVAGEAPLYTCTVDIMESWPDCTITTSLSPNKRQFQRVAHVSRDHLYESGDASSTAGFVTYFVSVHMFNVFV